MGKFVSLALLLGISGVVFASNSTSVDGRKIIYPEDLPERAMVSAKKLAEIRGNIFQRVKVKFLKSLLNEWSIWCAIFQNDVFSLLAHRVIVTLYVGWIALGSQNNNEFIYIMLYIRHLKTVFLKGGLAVHITARSLGTSNPKPRLADYVSFHSCTCI